MFTTVCPDDKRNNNYLLGLNAFELKNWLSAIFLGNTSFAFRLWMLPAAFDRLHMATKHSFSSQVQTDFNSSVFIE
jgi:hypothetical protein